jgi:hypothetical protein
MLISSKAQLGVRNEAQLPGRVTWSEIPCSKKNLIPLGQEESSEKGVSPMQMSRYVSVACFFGHSEGATLCVPCRHPHHYTQCRIYPGAKMQSDGQLPIRSETISGASTARILTVYSDTQTLKSSTTPSNNSQTLEFIEQPPLYFKSR